MMSLIRYLNNIIFKCRVATWRFPLSSTQSSPTPFFLKNNQEGFVPDVQFRLGEVRVRFALQGQDRFPWLVLDKQNILACQNPTKDFKLGIMISDTSFFYILQEKQRKKGSKYKNSGTLILNKFYSETPPSFLDYIKGKIIYQKGYFHEVHLTN